MRRKSTISNSDRSYLNFREDRSAGSLHNPLASFHRNSFGKQPMKVFDLDKIPPQSINGVYQRTLAHGQNLSVARLSVRKGAVTAPHKHEQEEIILILQGAWKFHLPTGDIILRANQVLTISPGTEHSSEVLEDVIAIDVCTPTREDWATQRDTTLHSDGDQFLWAV